jgi:hypothetical protein
VAGGASVPAAGDGPPDAKIQRATQEEEKEDMAAAAVAAALAKLGGTPSLWAPPPAAVAAGATLASNPNEHSELSDPTSLTTPDAAPSVAQQQGTSNLQDAAAQPAAVGSATTTHADGQKTTNMVAFKLPWTDLSTEATLGSRHHIKLLLTAHSMGAGKTFNKTVPAKTEAVASMLEATYNLTERNETARSQLYRLMGGLGFPADTMTTNDKPEWSS